MVEDTSLDPFGSLFADSPSDGHCNNQVIGAPKSSESSVNSNIGASRRHFSEHLPTKLYPELDGIEHSLDSRPQQSHESQNKLQSSGRTGSTSGYIIISERLGISGTVLEPRPFLPPPEQLMTTFERRKKVGQVRKIGACWQCQIRKIACSVDKICKRCQKMASTPTLAKQICLRQRFMDIYLSHSNDYPVTGTQYRVDQISPSHHGTSFSQIGSHG
ncbi:uncharacterized protein K444DRAFT_201859 [Hyaloscypha bicolor E]|uniref:Zn(2)-C6 fungal-type domain-containing protein n=1 Tax=Hyaloscypha bicolor E TaxID=1095630 RepID=A0A2J6SPB6_9HELO|nr:uncharacterized protein K444DRAFT_201859 [Hyaloscypha bicolor E]PMD52625.1 hypothetical protein K444DRAFT_201859 [Hyaloscypha bicolor E]